MTENKQNAVIACEIKISFTGRSFEEVRRLIEKVRECCASNDHKLEIIFSGDFLNGDNA
ncbi:MAG: hypothetical protein IKP64_00975 [Selenomonadaceae bacterium]|nr:hypothetical protein [Selenomonadaceae bacterium]MBR4382110.1 hypothetical protein [Selenomonadaceae bacterium]